MTATSVRSSAYWDYVRRTVEAAPPLTEEQRAELRMLIRSVRASAKRGAA